MASFGGTGASPMGPTKQAGFGHAPGLGDVGTDEKGLKHGRDSHRGSVEAQPLVARSSAVEIREGGGSEALAKAQRAKGAAKV